MTTEILGALEKVQFLLRQEATKIDEKSVRRSSA
jgi:hypothetical protein